MLTEDETGKADILADIEKRVGNIEKDFSEFEATDFAEYETSQYALINDNLIKWNTISNEIIDLASSGKSKEAIELFKGTGETIFEDLQTSIRDLVNYNIQEADNSYVNNKADSDTSTFLLIMLIIVISIICTLFGLLITLSITKPIAKVVLLLKKTSALDLVDDSSYASLYLHKDEIGIIAHAVEDLRNALRDIVDKISSVSDNLTASSKNLAVSTEGSTKTISQVVTAINEIAIGNNAQAEMVTNTSETIMTMVDSIEEVNKITVNNSSNAKKSIEIIKEGQKAIDLTMDKMGENIKIYSDVGKSINELSSQMDKVASIIDVIRTISKQTNLLALNASIEAARAGESGKGFAVVAVEIGKLANDTDNAVNEITGIITDAVSRNSVSARNTEIAKGIVSEQEKAINITKDAFYRIKDSVEDITTQTVDISKKIHIIDASARDISNQTQDMSAVAQQSAAGSEEISASNEEQLASIEMIASAAKSLSVMALELQNEINRFKLQ
jgi:methyl-accepting chemotaxis protein